MSSRQKRPRKKDVDIPDMEWVVGKDLRAMKYDPRPECDLPKPNKPKSPIRRSKHPVTVGPQPDDPAERKRWFEDFVWKALGFARTERDGVARTAFGMEYPSLEFEKLSDVFAWIMHHPRLDDERSWSKYAQGLYIELMAALPPIDEDDAAALIVRKAIALGRAIELARTEPYQAKGGSTLKRRRRSRQLSTGETLTNEQLFELVNRRMKLSNCRFHHRAAAEVAQMLEESGLSLTPRTIVNAWRAVKDERESRNLENS